MRRREFLTGLATAGAGALLGARLSAQQRGRGGRGGCGAARQRPIPPDVKNTRGIDVHHHYAPPGWIKVLAEQKALNVEPWMGWTPAKAIEAMDRPIGRLVKTPQREETPTGCRQRVSPSYP